MTMIYVSEAAERLGVSVATIHRWRLEGKIKGMRREKARNAFGFTWKVPVEALEGIDIKPTGKRSVNYSYGRGGKNR